MDVESFNDGILGAIVINEGGVANVGEPIAYIAESEADLEAAKAKASGSSGSVCASSSMSLFSLFPLYQHGLLFLPYSSIRIYM